MTELKDILKLSVEKRLHLVQTIWDSIAQDTENVEISEEHKTILNERLEAYQNNPEENITWDEVKKKVEEKL